MLMTGRAALGLHVRGSTLLLLQQIPQQPAAFSLARAAYAHWTRSATPALTSTTTTLAPAAAAQNSVLAARWSLLLQPVASVQPSASMSSFQGRKRKAMQKAVSQAEALSKRTTDPSAQQIPPELRDMRIVRLSPGFIVDDWVPLSPEEKPSIFSVAGLRYRIKSAKKILYSTLGMGMIRKNLPDFKPVPFAKEAEEEFIALQTALAVGDKSVMRELLTEDALTVLRHEFKNTHTWKFLESVERPRVVHSVVFPVEDKKNLFAQVTVRMHIKQIMAMYGPNGTVVKGSDTQPKDVVDYVVFERHIVKKQDSKWRICGKVHPKPLAQLLGKDDPKRVAIDK